uniref:Uncharacterized protein n=1 Tax=Physcomitrium patens TaxID=3218 RepID=A0A2K1KKK5_PHYPA|nr:hypothetical protein PHYPA_007987 [Physcomitrium patens]
MVAHSAFYGPVLQAQKALFQQNSTDVSFRAFAEGISAPNIYVEEISHSGCMLGSSILNTQRHSLGGAGHSDSTLSSVFLNL